MSLPAPASGRTALVTGASSGIGAEIARHLAARGHGLALVARREGPLRELADELTSGTGGIRVEVVPADLTDETSRAEIGRELAGRGLEVDVLVNNAGLSTMGPVHRAERDRELAMIRTDVEAVVDLCTTFLPGMVERGAGAVLNVASTAAFQPLPGQAGYSASKAFVLAYGHALRGELSGTGVSVTTLCPGPVETAIAEAAGISDEEAAKAMPKFMWLSATEVARQAVDGMAHGRSVVIPGAANKASAVGGYLTPRRALVPLLARAHPALRRH
jgi:short-subunit dehydrogenase